MSDNKYKVGIIGGGAVGLTYAAFLSETSDVVVKTRSQEQADQIKSFGIVLDFEGKKQQYKVIDSSADASSLSNCDVLILTVKSYDTDDLAKEIADVAKHDAEIVTLQNGLEAFNILHESISNPDRVFAGVTYIGGTRTDATTVKLGNNRKTVIDNKATKLISALSPTKYGVESSANIQQAVWDKMVLNTGQNALSAVTNLTLGEMLESKYCLEIASELLAELEHVAKAEGIAFDFSLMEKLKDNWQMSSFYPSMWQDLHNDRRTEVDAINGAISELGKKHGISAPYNSMITSLVKALEKS